MGLYEILLVLTVVFNAGGLIYAFRFHLASLKRGQKYLKEEVEKLSKGITELKDMVIQECRENSEEINKVKVEVAHIKGRLNKE